jgi:hypothetical protein
MQSTTKSFFSWTRRAPGNIAFGNPAGLRKKNTILVNYASIDVLAVYVMKPKEPSLYCCYCNEVVSGDSRALYN